MAALVGWSEENKKKAIEAVNNNSMSQRQAAFVFEVAKSSLNERLNEKHRGKMAEILCFRQLVKCYW